MSRPKDIDDVDPLEPSLEEAALTREQADAEALAGFQKLRERGSKKTL